MALQGIHDSLERDSQWAGFYGHPGFGDWDVQLMGEIPLDVEEQSAIFRGARAHAIRDAQFHAATIRKYSVTADVRNSSLVVPAIPFRGLAANPAKRLVR